MLTTHAAERTSVATVPFVYRYYPSVREARARIAAGNAGALRLLHGSYLQDWLADPAATNWRVDPAVGGPSRAFADIGVHWCDLVEFVTGHRIYQAAPPALIAARAGRPVPPKTAPPCCSTPTAAPPAAWWSARSHRAARTGCGSPWTASTRPTPSTRRPPSTSGSVPRRRT